MKTAQFNIRVIFAILFSLFVLFILILSVRYVKQLNSNMETAEIINLKTSIATKLLQQSVRQDNSDINYSFSVPSSVRELCFFDAKRKFSNLKNPELTRIYKDDENNNLFLKVGSQYLRYKLENLEVSENPICPTITNNKISVNILTKKQRSVVSAEDEASKCVAVLENGDYAKKIDIVFLGYGFKDSSEYTLQVNRYVNNVLLSFSPYSKYKSKFNFFRIDNSKIKCTIGDFIKCDQYEIKQEASDCPNDFIVVLVSRNAIVDFVLPVRSSAIGNIMKLNTADKPFVLVHELGHSFADLADEYVDESYYGAIDFDPSTYLNCDPVPCSTWKNVNNTGCFQGCSLNRYYRPTQDSIMRSLNSLYYGPVNEEEIQRRPLFYE